MTDLPPKNPRTKKPKPGAAKGKKIVQQNLRDASRITKGVPDKIKIAMADAIMAFSDMEMSAEQFIWDLLGLSDDDGKLVTRIDTKDKIELYHTLIRVAPNGSSPASPATAAGSDSRPNTPAYRDAAKVHRGIAGLRPSARAKATQHPGN